MKSRSARALAVSLLALAPTAAYAGPPLVCWPMSIGDAPSLPWGAGWHDARGDYDRSRLASDTLALLAPQTGALVRMETLRRAALYASSDAEAAKQLLAALRARAARGGDERAQALARFDLGYEAEAYRQTFWGQETAAGAIETPEDSYALVHQALDALRPNPEMEYAAALLTLSRPALPGRSNRDLARKHLQVAAAATSDGSDLARTLAAHAPLWGAEVTKPATAAAR